MNEIMLLETYGPQGQELSDEARRAARARLLAETSGRPPILFPRLVAAGSLRIRLAVAGVGLAAVAATAVAFVPDAWHSTPAPSVSSDRIKLVSAAAPEFPYALPQLGKPSFTAEPDGPIMAVYPAADGGEFVLTAGTAPPDQHAPGEHDINVDGHPGRVVTGTNASGTVMFVQLSWERRPGAWVTIIRNGSNARVESVLELARQVVDEPQRVPFKITIGLVPDGWELGGFKDGGSIISYRDPAKPTLTLWAQWTPEPDTSGNSEIEGFETAQAVTVDAKPAKLVRSRDFWRLTATLPDGSGFTLITPRSFSPEQVVAVAQSVQVNPA